MANKLNNLTILLFLLFFYYYNMYKYFYAQVKIFVEKTLFGIFQSY